MSRCLFATRSVVSTLPIKASAVAIALMREALSAADATTYLAKQHVSKFIEHEQLHLGLSVCSVRR
ncbi:hypothetical protein [Caballeronia eucalypticola]|uniref:hypothetical protein n=1 Tax=Caballeronia sp. 15715 TaxID=3391030 RepID=UPI0039E515C1